MTVNEMRSKSNLDKVENAAGQSTIETCIKGGTSKNTSVDDMSQGPRTTRYPTQGDGSVQENAPSDLFDAKKENMN